MRLIKDWTGLCRAPGRDSYTLGLTNPLQPLKSIFQLLIKGRAKFFARED